MTMLDVLDRMEKLKMIENATFVPYRHPKDKELMRLTSEQQTLIHDCLQKHFGQDTRIWLFGSRLDDRAKGGDIDLYLEPGLQDPAALVEAKLHALRELHQRLGEQRIDLVIRRNSAPNLAIYQVALENGVRL